MIINLLVIAFTLLGTWDILLNKNGLENSLNWIILGFVLGYRTFEPVAGLKLHPIELFIYITFIRIIISQPVSNSIIPKSIKILSVFFVAFFILDIVSKYNPIVLMEFKNAFLLIMTFVILQYISITKVVLIRVSKYYLFSASIISILGIIEYSFPTLMSSIFGYQNKVQYDFQPELFNRLAFLFWGSHLAANLIPPIFPILLLLKSEKDSIVENNFFLTLLVFVNLFAIYLSGNRISWLILTLFIIITLFFYNNKFIPYLKTYSLILIVAFITYIYSQPVQGRYISTFKALTGNIDTQYDSSGGARMNRALIALNSIKRNPMGTGWGSQGWVHSDILQIGASVGVIPGLFLLFGPSILLFKLFRRYFIASPDLKTSYFICSLFQVYVLVSLVLNGNILLVQTGMPLFILWAINYGFFKHTKNYVNPLHE